LPEQGEVGVRQKSFVEGTSARIKPMAQELVDDAIDRVSGLVGLEQRLHGGDAGEGAASSEGLGH